MHIRVLTKELSDQRMRCLLQSFSLSLTLIFAFSSQSLPFGHKWFEHVIGHFINNVCANAVNPRWRVSITTWPSCTLYNVGGICWGMVPISIYYGVSLLQHNHHFISTTLEVYVRIWCRSVYTMVCLYCNIIIILSLQCCRYLLGYGADQYILWCVSTAT